MSEARRDASHALCRADIASDHAASVTGAQRIDATGVAPRHVRGVWLVPPTTSAQERAELARDGAEVRDGWWLEKAVWTAGDGA